MENNVVKFNIFLKFFRKIHINVRFKAIIMFAIYFFQKEIGFSNKFLNNLFAKIQFLKFKKKIIFFTFIWRCDRSMTSGKGKCLSFTSFVMLRYVYMFISKTIRQYFLGLHFSSHRAMFQLFKISFFLVSLLKIWLFDIFPVFLND